MSNKYSERTINSALSSLTDDFDITLTSNIMKNIKHNNNKTDMSTLNNFWKCQKCTNENRKNTVCEVCNSINNFMNMNQNHEECKPSEKKSNSFVDVEDSVKPASDIENGSQKEQSHNETETKPKTEPMTEPSAQKSVTQSVPPTVQTDKKNELICNNCQEKGVQYGYCKDCYLQMYDSKLCVKCNKSLNPDDRSETSSNYKAGKNYWKCLNKKCEKKNRVQEEYCHKCSLKRNQKVTMFNLFAVRFPNKPERQMWYCSYCQQFSFAANQCTNCMNLRCFPNYKKCECNWMNLKNATTCAKCNEQLK